MPRAGFAPEERLGLLLAVALHGGVLALLLSHRADKVIAPPPRMEVTLTDKVGLTDSAPAAHEQAAADIAPQLGAAPPPPAPPPAKARPPLSPVPPLPMQQPPPPLERQAPRPFPSLPKPLPAKPLPPKPAPAKPAPQPSARPSPQPSRPASPRAAPSPHPAPHPALPDHPAKVAKTTGGSRIGADFLKGVTSANTTGKAKTPPAQTAGPAVQSAIAGVISRQLKEHWVAPQGADADRLVTILAFDLNRDGTLNGPPRVVRQEGVTDSNRPQAARHAEQAVRAVELAEPFQLPPDYYDTWTHIGSSRFDRKMSQ